MGSADKLSGNDVSGRVVTERTVLVISNCGQKLSVVAVAGLANARRAYSTAFLYPARFKSSNITINPWPEVPPECEVGHLPYHVQHRYSSTPLPLCPSFRAPSFGPLFLLLVQVLRLARSLPALHIETAVQPVTRGILRLTLRVHADFIWQVRPGCGVERWKGGGARQGMCRKVPLVVMYSTTLSGNVCPVTPLLYN